VIGSRRECEDDRTPSVPAAALAGQILAMCLLAVCSVRLHAGTNAVADESKLEARWQEVRSGFVLFHSYRCQYCQKELAFLESIRSRYPEIRFSFIEIARPENTENNALFSYVMKRLGSNDQGVPRTVVNGKVFIGYLEGDCAMSFNEVYKAYNGCQTLLLAELDALAREAGREPQPATPAVKRKFVVYNNLTLFLLVPMFLLSRYVFKDRLTTPQARRYWLAGLFALVLACIILFLVLTPQSQILKAAESMPFPAFVFFIAIVDGFNPCSFSILIIFLSLLTYTRARRDMILVGGTFIVVSAVVYGILILSMMALTSVFFGLYEDLIGKVLGALILVLGIINVKDLVVPGKGPSLAVPAARKAAIVRRFSRIVDLLKRNSFLAVTLGMALTIVLSVGVNLIELGCTAILPAVYMTSVMKRFGSTIRAPHVLWTVFYAGIYVLPLVFLLVNFILTFRSRRMTERQGRTLKIVSGFVMIAFALVMIVKPELLSFT
jgi:hypothetical protein